MKAIPSALAALVLASAARGDEKVEVKKDKNDVSIDKERTDGGGSHW